MAFYERNSGKHWTRDQIRTLKEGAATNTPSRVIGLKTGHPVAGVYAKASELGVGLKPTNQSPYNRRK